jgi:hypothetical protein
MKNSIVYIGIALVSLGNIGNAANVLDKQMNTFQAETLAENNILNGTETLKFYNINPDSIAIEVIESVNKTKIVKSTDELFAEDNAITENNISNETQALDFEIINSNSIVEEVVEIANLSKIEKTPEELIAEDNAITENNLSNETQALDFRIINKNSNLLTSKKKVILGNKLKL